MTISKKPEEDAHPYGTPPEQIEKKNIRQELAERFLKNLDELKRLLPVLIVNLNDTGILAKELNKNTDSISQLGNNDQEKEIDELLKEVYLSLVEIDDITIQKTKEFQALVESVSSEVSTLDLEINNTYINLEFFKDPDSFQFRINALKIHVHSIGQINKYIQEHGTKRVSEINIEEKELLLENTKGILQAIKTIDEALKNIVSVFEEITDFLGIIKNPPHIPTLIPPFGAIPPPSSPVPSAPAVPSDLNNLAQSLAISTEPQPGNQSEEQSITATEPLFTSKEDVSLVSAETQQNEPLPSIIIDPTIADSISPPSSSAPTVPAQLIVPPTTPTSSTVPSSSSPSSPVPAQDLVSPTSTIPKQLIVTPTPANPTVKKSDESYKRLERKENELKEKIRTLSGTLSIALQNTLALDQVLTNHILPKFSEEIDSLTRRKKSIPDELANGQQSALLGKAMTQGIADAINHALQVCSALQVKKIAIQDLHPSVLMKISEFIGKSHDIHRYITDTQKIIDIRKFNRLTHALRRKFTPERANKMESQSLNHVGDAIIGYQKGFTRLSTELAYIIDQLSIIDTHSISVPAQLVVPPPPSSPSSSPSSSPPSSSSSSSPSFRAEIKGQDKSTSKVNRKKVEQLQTDLAKIKYSVERINNAVAKMKDAIEQRTAILSQDTIVKKVSPKLQNRVTKISDKANELLSHLETIKKGGENIIHLQKTLRVADITPPKHTTRESPYDHEEMRRFASELRSHVAKITEAIYQMDSTGATSLPNDPHYNEELVDDACNDILVAERCIHDLHDRLVTTDYAAFIAQLEAIKNDAILHPEMENRRSIREKISQIAPAGSIGLGLLGLAGIGLVAIIGSRNCDISPRYSARSDAGAADASLAILSLPDARVDTHYISDAGIDAFDSAMNARDARTDIHDVLDAGHDVDVVAPLDSGLLDGSIRDSGRDTEVADAGITADADSPPEAGNTDASVVVAARPTRHLTVYPPYSLVGERAEIDQCVGELRTAAIMCMQIMTTIGVDGEHRIVGPIPFPRDIQRENHLDTRRTSDDTAHMDGNTFTFMMNGQLHTCTLDNTVSRVGTYYTHVPCTRSSR